MENIILNLCAYHESGRVVFAYMAGFTCDSMELSATDPGRGKSGLNGGQEVSLIQQILSGNHLTITPESRNQAIDLAQRLMDVYCAGTCAQIYFEQNGQIDGDIELDIPVQDERPISAIQKFLTGIIPGHTPHYPSQKMGAILQKLKDPEIWKPIVSLANTAINNAEKPLTRFEIEDALMAGGLRIRRTASPGFSVGLTDAGKHDETPAPPKAKEFETEPTADILLKDFFRKVRKDWGEADVAAAVAHVKDIIAKY